MKEGGVKERGEEGERERACTCMLAILNPITSHMNIIKGGIPFLDYCLISISYSSLLCHELQS